MSGFLHRWALGLLETTTLVDLVGQYTWAKQEHTYVNTDLLDNNPRLTSVTLQEEKETLLSR